MARTAARSTGARSAGATGTTSISSSREETHGRTWRTLSALRSPARTVVFAELNNTTTADHAMAHFWTQFGAPPEIDGDRHRPGTGAAFADGHAESADFASLFDPDTGRDCFNPATAR